MGKIAVSGKFRVQICDQWSQLPFNMSGKKMIEEAEQLLDTSSRRRQFIPWSSSQEGGFHLLSLLNTDPSADVVGRPIPHNEPSVRQWLSQILRDPENLRHVSRSLL